MIPKGLFEQEEVVEVLDTAMSKNTAQVQLLTSGMNNSSCTNILRMVLDSPC